MKKTVAEGTALMTQDDLMTIMYKHWKWLKFDGGEKADLSYRDLRGLNLKGFVLQRVNFQDANLSGMCLYECDFSNANLRNADFSNADLRRAIFIRAALKGVILDGANIRTACFSSARFADVLKGMDTSTCRKFSRKLYGAQS